VLQCCAVCCSVLQCVAVSILLLQSRSASTHLHCNTLKHTALFHIVIFCNALQHTTTHCNTQVLTGNSHEQRLIREIAAMMNLRYTCNTLQYALRVYISIHIRSNCVWQFAYTYTVCCSVLQCVAVCCCVLLCVAVCCSILLQCVAVCCSSCYSVTLVKSLL